MDYANLHNTDLEQSVLSVLIYDCYADFSITTDGLTEDCFTQPELRRLFKAMQTMYSQGQSVHDPMLIIDAINRTAGEDPPMTIPQFVNMLAGDGHRNEVAVNVPHYISILIDLARRRHMYRIIQRAQGQIVDMTQDTEQTVNLLINDATLNGTESGTSVLSFRQMTEQLMQRIDDNSKGLGQKGMPTGFRYLDKTGGLHSSDLVVVAADSSQGKTALATTFIMNIALANHSQQLQTTPRLAYYSMEMTPMQLIARMIAHKVEISSSRMTYQALDPIERNRFDVTTDELKTLNDSIFVDERAITTPESIIQSIRYLHALHSINVAVVDYLQILGLKTSNAVKRHEAIADAARKFKNLARELDIVIILLSQLNRENSLQNPQPSVQRIRESGEINEAADLTLLIYRPEVYERLYPQPFQDVATHNTAMISVGKDRNGTYGGVGSFIVGFKPDYSYFHDLQTTPLRNNLPDSQLNVPWEIN